MLAVILSWSSYEFLRAIGADTAPCETVLDLANTIRSVYGVEWIGNATRGHSSIILGTLRSFRFMPFMLHMGNKVRSRRLFYCHKSLTRHEIAVEERSRFKGAYVTEAEKFDAPAFENIRDEKASITIVDVNSWWFIYLSRWILFATILCKFVWNIAIYFLISVCYAKLSITEGEKRQKQRENLAWDVG